MPPKRDEHYRVAHSLADPERALSRVLDRAKLPGATKVVVLAPSRSDDTDPHWHAAAYVQFGADESATRSYHTAWIRDDERPGAFAALVASLLRAGVFTVTDVKEAAH